MTKNVLAKTVASILYKLYEPMLSRREDSQLNNIANARAAEKIIKITLDQL